MRLTVDYVTSDRSGHSGATPGLGISEPGSFPLRRGAQVPLYSLCSLLGPSALDTVPVVSDAMHSEFAAASGRSITSALMRALRTAMDTLDRENARSLPQHRCGGAVCAAAVKGDALYLAAVGGGVAYLWQDGVLRLLLGHEGQADAEFADECEVALSSCQLKVGDAVVLGSPGLAVMASDGALASVLQGIASTDQIAEALDTVHVMSPRRQEFTAVVLASAADVEPPRADKREKRAPLSQDRTRDKPAPSVPDASPPYRTPAADTKEGPGREPRKTITREQASESSGVSRSSPTEHGSSFRFSLQRALLRLSALIVVLAALAFAVYLGEGYFSAQAKNAQAAEVLSDLERKERDALAATDPASKRWLLVEAGRAADSALLSNNPDAKVREIANRIKARLDEVNGVVRLSGLQVLADLSSRDKLSQPAQIMGIKDDLYVLDRGIGGVWHVKLGKDLGAVTQPDLLWRRGTTVRDVTLGEALAFFWMHVAAPGVPEQVYTLDSAGHLVSFSGGSTGDLLHVPAAGALAKVRAAAGQAGNLYVLDTQRRVVWRYTPGANGYQAAGQEYLTEDVAPELANATDMSIDGNLYLLLSDERVVKYASGKAQSFPGVIPDTPLRRPSSVFTSPSVRYVYVADSGNNRVVQFTKEGQYVRQFRASNNSLDGVKAVHVDEKAGLLFAVAGTRALVAQLPVEVKQ